jgi:hypothetical protein
MERQVAGDQQHQLQHILASKQNNIQRSSFPEYA